MENNEKEIELISKNLEEKSERSMVGKKRNETTLKSIFKNSGDVLYAYVDIDSDTDVDSRLRVSGWIIFINGCVLTWGSRGK